MGIKADIRSGHMPQMLGWIGDGAADLQLHDLAVEEMKLSNAEATKLVAEARQAVIDLEPHPEGYYRLAFRELHKSCLSEKDFSTAYKALSMAQRLDETARAARDAPQLEDSREGAVLLLASVIRRLLLGELTNATAQTAIQATQALIRSYDASEETTEEKAVEIPDIAADALTRRFTDALEAVLSGRDFDLH